MKLGTRGRYAVAAMVDLAHHYDEKGPITLAEIAGRQNLPVSYLEQLFSKLRKAGLIQSHRGQTGGYTLAKPSPEISVTEIISAVDETIQATGCSKKGVGCRGGTSLCQTHKLWDSLGHHIQTYLSHISLDDICHNRFNA